MLSSMMKSRESCVLLRTRIIPLPSISALWMPSALLVPTHVVAEASQLSNGLSGCRSACIQVTLILATNVSRVQEWPKERTWSPTLKWKAWKWSTYTFLSSHIKRRASKYSTIRYFERERPHSHSFYYSILLQLSYFIISYCCESLTVPDL